MKQIPFVASLAVLGCSLSAQASVHGNGFPSAYVENSPGMLGGTLNVGYGSPTTPGGVAVVSISGSFAPFAFPFPELGGPLALSPLDPAYQFFFFGLDALGNGSVAVPLPTGFAPPTAPPLFVNTLTFDSPSQWSVSKTARIDWMLPDAWEPVGALTAARQLHTATALGSGPRDNITEVLICGGATGSIILPTPTATAELFSPLLRQTTPLPNMSLPRAGHGAVRLADGRVLVTGGVTAGGLVTATCEFFDPALQQFVPAPTMLAPRTSHALTLLADGRVLASGGFADWQNAATAFVAALNTAQNSAEIFDPVAQTWLPLPAMVSKRAGHSQTLLPDGRVLVVSGIQGGRATQIAGISGQVPIYTATSQLFVPATLQWASAPGWDAGLGGLLFSPRAFHGASLLPGGQVLLTGGIVVGGTFSNTEGPATPTAQCVLWNGSNWVATAPLAIPAAFHQQLATGSGAIAVGGFTGDLTSLQTTDQVVLHDGTTATSRAPLPQGRGTHTLTRLCDGTFLVYGGGQWPNTLGDGWVFALP